MEVESKAREMGMRPLYPTHPEPGEDFWTKIESAGLPNDYAAFVRRFPTTQVFDKDVCFPANSPTAENGMESLDVLFASSEVASNDIIAVNAAYADALGTGLFVIGEATTSPICLELRSGAIKLWDRNAPGGIGRNLHAVAESFLDFFISLSECKEVDDHRKVISVNLSDELRAKAAAYLRRKQQQ